MKIVYAGTPQYAVAPLKALVENGFEVIAVVTQEDRRQARAPHSPARKAVRAGARHSRIPVS